MVVFFFFLASIFAKVILTDIKNVHAAINGDISTELLPVQ